MDAFNVATEDDYELTVFEMSASDKCDNIKNPILLMHGHESCSDFAVLMGAHDGLAYNLVDDCRTVYLGNARSNIYSQRHKTFSKNSFEFWNFSYYEIGYFDLAAIFTKILQRHDNASHVDFIGHSQACAEVLVLLTERTEFQNKIGSLVLLAPSVYMQHTQNRIVQTMAEITSFLSEVNILGNWLQTNIFSQAILRFLCGNSYCTYFMENFMGGTSLVNKVSLLIIIRYVYLKINSLLLSHISLKYL